MKTQQLRWVRWLAVAATCVVAACGGSSAPGPEPAPDPSTRPAVSEDRFTVRFPAGDAPHPVVVMIHGGEFTSGDRDQPHLEVVAAEFRERGYATVSVDYRVEPQIEDRLEEYAQRTGEPYSCDPALEATGDEDPADLGGPGRPCLLYLRVIERAHGDVLAALDDLREAGPGLGLEVGEVAVYGESAGGTLALELALDDGDTDLVAAVVAAASGANVPADAQVLVPVLLVSYEDATVEVDNLEGPDQVAILRANAEALRAAGSDASLLLLPGSEHLPAAGSAELDLMVARSVELFEGAGIAPS